MTIEMPKIKDITKDNLPLVKILTGIEALTKVGYILVNKGWGNKNTKSASALGCTLLYMTDNLSDSAAENEMKATQLLHVSPKWIASFISGFDADEEFDLSDHEAYHLGMEFRKQFNPVSQFSLETRKKLDSYAAHTGPEYFE